MPERQRRSGRAPAGAGGAHLHGRCVFHPFVDGNGRAALLALDFVLLREGVLLDQVGPLQVARFGDDSAGAVDRVQLVDILIRTAQRRGPASGP
ncbi:Fic family protein [Sinosporangium siamense]|uniref:Fic family protein n=1 Tax=Sinosporangium siamense TaxID=1367973 RepID=UPI001951EEC8|nr:Fic family protein [Sinosporangium siamense]